MESPVNKRAQDLARLWGKHFGNPVFGHTLGMMKNYLLGNEEDGRPAYRYDRLRGCIEWLAKARKEGKLKKPVKGPGVIAWVIEDFIAGKDISDTFLGYEKPTATVRML